MATTGPNPLSRRLESLSDHRCREGENRQLESGTVTAYLVQDVKR